VIAGAEHATNEATIASERSALTELSLARRVRTSTADSRPMALGYEQMSFQREVHMVDESVQMSLGARGSLPVTAGPIATWWISKAFVPGELTFRIWQAHAAGMTTTHAHLRSVLIGMVLAALIAAGCGAVQSQALLATLPTSAGGVTFDTSRVIDDSFLSGHPVDDILAALGKRRSDATIVDRYPSTGVGGSIGALAVNGISGDVLLDTVVQTWLAAALVGRAQTTIGDRDVWALDIRPNHVFLAYRRGSTIYWADSDDRSLAEQFVAAMP
jgi:hypothetical protein